MAALKTGDVWLSKTLVIAVYKGTLAIERFAVGNSHWKISRNAL